MTLHNTLIKTCFPFRVGQSNTAIIPLNMYLVMFKYNVMPLVVVIIQTLAGRWQSYKLHRLTINNPNTKKLMSVSFPYIKGCPTVQINKSNSRKLELMFIFICFDFSHK